MSDDERPDDPDSGSRSLRKLARGFRKRTLTSAKLAAKVGIKAAKRQLSRGWTPGDENPEETETDLEGARKLVEELGSLKGLMMKFGQIASYMPGAMTPKAQRILSQLQAHTTAMEWDTVREVLEAELSGDTDALFEGLQTKPFAAASIGQVHRAQHEGRDVAVKIQYPGIEDVLAEDLRSAKLMARVSTFGMAMDGPVIIEEIRQRMLEECDYELEARSQQTFREIFDPLPGATAPEVVAERSSGRVLTSVLDPGVGFQTFVDTASQQARDRAAAVIFGTCFRCIFSHCIYNADPHPGNYLLSLDGDVTFLDFGCVRHFDPTMIDAWRRVAKATLAGDAKAFRDSYVDLGFVPKPDKFDWEHQWSMMQYLYRPFLTTEPFTYTHDYVRESYGLMIFDNPNRFKTAMPSQWVFLNRLQWGLNSILAALNASARYGELYREALDLPSDPVHVPGHPGLSDAHRGR